MKISKDRTILNSFKLVFSGSIATIATPVAGKTLTEKPNIILILADDMGFSDLGCYGGEIQTPVLDSLAANGLRYNSFYNSARSCPSRASLLTGLYPHQAGMGDMVYSTMNKKGLPGYQSQLNRQSVTIAEVLKTVGYHTFMSGKWHLGDSLPDWPTQRGFDRYFGLISGASNYFNLSKEANAGSIRILASNNSQITEVSPDFYMTEAITDSALSMIAGTADNEPFFMYLAYTAPHWPLHANQKDIDIYKGKYDIGWDSIREHRYNKQKTLKLFDNETGLSVRNETVPAWNVYADKGIATRKMEIYAAMVHTMDREIGRLLEHLKQTGKDKNTIIIFLSDNGACDEHGVAGFDRMNNGTIPGSAASFLSYGASWANACNAPFRYFKQQTYEGGITNPAIIYWPEVIKNKGSIVADKTHLVDILPTVIEISGSKYPSVYNGNQITKPEGESLVPDFEGKKLQKHKFLAWEHEGNKAIIVGDIKCVKHRNGNWEMYDLKKDRIESINIIDKNKSKFRKILRKYKSWEKRVGVVEFE